MGGAMDLVNGAKHVYIMMEHFTKNKQSKLVKKCTLPLTGLACVEIIFTNLGVFKPQDGKFEVLALSIPQCEFKSLLKDDLYIF